MDMMDLYDGAFAQLRGRRLLCLTYQLFLLPGRIFPVVLQQGLTSGMWQVKDNDWSEAWISFGDSANEEACGQATVFISCPFFQLLCFSQQELRIVGWNLRRGNIKLTQAPDCLLITGFVLNNDIISYHNDFYFKNILYHLSTAN